MSNELMTSIKGELSQMSIEDLYTNTLSPLTKVNYISTIKSFFGVKDLSEISIRDMQSIDVNYVNIWARRELMNGNAKSTINRKLSAMSNFYDFLCRRDVRIMDYNPFHTSQGAIRFKNATRDYSDKRVLSPKEIGKMFKCCVKDDTIIGVRDLLVLQLLATTGMRRAELCGIKIGDIKTINNTHVIDILGKGDKARMIVVAQHIYELMLKYINLRGVTLKDRELPLIVSHSSNADPTKHLDTSTIFRIVKRRAGEANIDPSTISPHCFRVAFATTGYGELDIDLDTLQELMGHSSSSTTRRYAKTVKMLKNNPAEKLAELYEIE